MKNTEYPQVYPTHYRVIRRVGNEWKMPRMSIFYNPSGVPVDPNDIEGLYGIRFSKLCIDLWRVKGGQQGYYLADLRSQEYYYCGTEQKGVKDKFIELGIGVSDPLEA